MPGALHDRVVIVTGASSGIGRATAQGVAAEGGVVVLAARRADRLQALERAIIESGGRAAAVSTDVTERSEVEHLAATTLDRFGRIDILVNNAGIMPLSPIRQLRVEDWDRMLDVNVRGLLYCVAAVLPHMRERGAGHIINVGSVAGRRPFPSGTIYAATKFAVRAISDGLRLELSASDGIRVTDVEPGVVDTELQDHVPDHETKERFAAVWRDKTPLAAEDIARAILYAATQPDRVNINEILVRPTHQET